jgi:SP family myo-inositol transporter-like MFS transporter 13
MMKAWTPSGAFGFYMAICTLGWVFILFCFPECKGMPLEAVRDVFSTGFGVKKSKKWQKEHKNEKKVQSMVIGH